LPPAQLTPALPPEIPQPAVALQNVASVCGSMQLPLQLTCVPGHETEHKPAVQTSPAAQGVPAFTPMQLVVAPQ
jgi:hypothetical protein